MHHIPLWAGSSQEFLPVSLYDEKAESLHLFLKNSLSKLETFK